MFLENIEMTFMAPCVSEENKIRLIAQMSTDISEVMPYLAFAVKLLLGQQKIVNCKPLFKPENANMKNLVFDVVSALGYEV